MPRKEVERVLIRLPGTPSLMFPIPFASSNLKSQIMMENIPFISFATLVSIIDSTASRTEAILIRKGVNI